MKEEDLVKKARQIWNGIRQRVRKNTAYRDVKICEEWEKFDNFLEWFKDQVDKGWYRYGRQIDKDLLSPKNVKIYSPETCCFVPPRVNAFAIDSSNKKRSLPPAVRYNSYLEFYYCQYSLGGDNKMSEYFDCPYKAFLHYKTTKEDMARQVAEVIKDRVDPRVYEALKNYTITWDGEEAWHKAKEVFY
jgi:hypothetical protein